MYSNISKLSILFSIALVSCSAIDVIDEEKYFFFVTVYDCNVPIPSGFILDASNKTSFFYFRHKDFLATAVDQKPERSSIRIEEIVDGMSIEKRVDMFRNTAELFEIGRHGDLRLFDVLAFGEHSHFIITDGVTEMTFIGPHTSIEYLDGILAKCGG